MKTITAKEIQEIRQRTGAGITDCKKALEEANGDLEQAVEILRKKGIAKADKRSGRTASEGRIVNVFSPDRKTGVLLEVNSETDFVSRNADFGSAVDALAQQLLADKSVDGIIRDPATDAFGLSVQDEVKGISAKTGENIVLRRYARFTTDGALGSYVHHNGKVAALVEVGGSSSDSAVSAANSVAEHVAAGVPTVAVAVNREGVSAELVARERRIFEEQAKASGKPDNIVAKMVEGRIGKFYGEVALVEQPWVRDDSRTIQSLLDEHGKAAGSALTIRRFVRFKMDEE
ncbi:MAG TPA: translation elongation factor Ts [Gemmatimonadaceae bacterium]|nr:translation elongation factor Ts [Gemmatimonadaceae bacterium]